MLEILILLGLVSYVKIILLLEEAFSLYSYDGFCLSFYFLLIASVL